MEQSGQLARFISLRSRRSNPASPTSFRRNGRMRITDVGQRWFVIIYFILLTIVIGMIAWVLNGMVEVMN